MIIKMNPKMLEELYWCEYGAHEDGTTGPSPLTTCTILERHKDKIELQTIEEAVQIYDCTIYGTFPYHCPKAADNLNRKIRERWGKELIEAWNKHNASEFGSLRRIILATCGDARFICNNGGFSDSTGQELA